MTNAIAFVPYVEVATREAIASDLDAIFYEASNTKSFTSDAERAAFRDRWLGRYLEHDPAYAQVALDPSGAIVGYVVGALDDPARASRFADIGYFATFSKLTMHYPAHLHVNVAPDFRNRGVGADLVRRFIACARAAGSPGVHVVTGASARNVPFYRGLSFAEVGRTGEGAGEVVFLAQPL